MDYYCKVCHETGEAEVSIEFTKDSTIEFVHCSNCGSDCVIRVDDMFDEAEFLRGEER